MIALAILILGGMGWWLFGAGRSLAGLWYGNTPAPAALHERMQRGHASGPGRRVYRLGDSVGEAFALSALDGSEARLSEYRGRPVLLNFWATWCAPCLEEMPLLEAAHHEHPRAQIIGIAMDKPAAVRAWLAHTPVSYPLWLGKTGPADTAALFGDSRGLLPYSVLLDASGRVVDTHLGRLNRAQLRRWLMGPDNKGLQAD